MHRHAVESRRAPRRLDLRPGGGSPGAADRPDPAFAKTESATAASRRRQRVARLPVGAAPPRQEIKTSPKCQRESTAETGCCHFYEALDVPGNPAICLAPRSPHAQHTKRRRLADL